MLAPVRHGFSWAIAAEGSSEVMVDLFDVENALRCKRMASRRYERFYAIVRQIPAGSVATYGQVALLADLPGRARQVGYALFRVAPEETADIPWHRVVNARGEISASPARNGSDRQQKELLLAEGIAFDASDRIDLERYRWQVGPARPR